MGKIKNYFNEQRKIVTDVCKRYIATWISFALLFISFIIFDLFDNICVNDLEERIPTIFIVIGCMCFFFESLFDGEKVDRITRKLKINIKVFKIICYVISFSYGLVFEEVNYHFVDISTNISYEIVTRWLYYILLSVVLIGFYFTIENTGLDIGNYIRTTIGNIASLLATYGVINIGLIIVLELFDSLIFDIHLWEWAGNMELLILAIVYVPLALYSITDKRAIKAGKGKIIFYRCALMPLVMATTIIIYLYLIKVILGLDDSSNVIYKPCMWLFIIGAPIWEMSNLKEFEEDTSLWNKIIKNMPYIYAPLILLEIYAISERIAAYGLTQNRYMAIMFILFQIVYVLWNGRDKRKLILVIFCLLTIGMVVPFINAFYSCYASQRAIFEKNYSKSYESWASEGDSDCVKKFYGAYRFLKYDTRGLKYIRENYDEEKLDNYSSYISQDIKNKHYDDVQYIRYDCSSEGMEFNIMGYSYMYHVDSFNYDENESDYYKTYEINYGNNNEKLIVDLSEIMTELNKKYNSSRKYNENNEPIELNIGSNKKMIITNIQYEFTLNKGLYKNFYISGYILAK